MSVTVTVGDTQPQLTITLYTDETKTTVVDLTTATSVTWHLVRNSADIAKTATIATDRTTGKTTWQFDGDPLITAGSWQIRSVIVWNDSSIETSTNTEYLVVLPAA